MRHDGEAAGSAAISRRTRYERGKTLRLELPQRLGF
jgi:hypothetical protein